LVSFKFNFSITAFPLPFLYTTKKLYIT